MKPKTLKEAKSQGYKVAERKFTRLYVSRTATNHAVYEAQGSRKGELYILEPNWGSSFYSFRAYLAK